MSSQPVREFILRERPTDDAPWTAVSLFTGAGLSDLGYEMAGFRFIVQVEIDQRRAAIGADNFPTSQWLTCDARDSGSAIAVAYCRSTTRRLDLLVATPPCQGMSSSNPSRGKRQTPQAKALEEKNRLLLEVIPIARLLKPRIIVIENVRQVLTLDVEYDGTKGTAVDILHERLPEYKVFPGVVNVADYGIPQVRKRALVVAIHKDEHGLERLSSRDHHPWPSPTHQEKASHRYATVGERAAMARSNEVRTAGREVQRHGAWYAPAALRSRVRPRPLPADQPNSSVLWAECLRE